MGEDGRMMLLDFARGEARWMDADEVRQRREEMRRRVKFKDGVVYVDCDPPDDPADGEAVF